MTMAMRAARTTKGAARVLRLGVVEQGRIVSERLVREREKITIGPDERCDLVLPVTRGVLFSPAPDGRIWLHLRPDMTGRVSGADGMRDLEAAVRQGVKKIALDDQARGKVVVGDTVVLLQMVHAPPAMPKPQLPAAVRGGFVRSIDWRFTGFVTMSFVAFLSFMVFLESADFPMPQSVAILPDEFATLLLQEPEPPPEPVVPEALDGDSADAPSDQVADANDTPAEPSHGHARPSSDERPTIADAEQNPHRGAPRDRDAPFVGRRSHVSGPPGRRGGCLGRGGDPGDGGRGVEQRERR